MELMINGAKTDLGDQWSQKTLEETLTHISNDRIPQDEVITDVTVDGHWLSSEQEDKLSGHSMEGIGLLEIATAKPTQLARDGLQEALTYMDKLNEGLSQVALLFRQGKTGEALRLFDVALEGMSWFANLVSMGERFNSINYRTFSVSGKTIAAHYIDMGAMVKELSEIQKRSDWPQAADYLEKRLMAHFDFWKELLPSMIDGIKQAG